MAQDHDDHDLGYAGTLGWSGSETSQIRAEDEANSGLSSARLSLAYDLVNKAGAYGLTYKEIGGLTGWHHGQSSSVLSNLHKAGDLARLVDTRSRCKIYVTPTNIDDRATERHGRNTPPPAQNSILSDAECLALVEARVRAREAYRKNLIPEGWPDLPSFIGFWKIITKIIDDHNG